MTRERAIELIGAMKGDLCDFYDYDDLEALEMAIASLKTDEAYQLEYENRDFIEIPEGMTNGEVLISLYPNLKYTIQNGRVVTTIGVASSFDLDWWNSPYQKGGE